MLQLRNLSKKYKDKIILKNINLEIKDPSKIHVLIGESGSGKTTLFNLLMGLDRDYTGDYSLFDKPALEITNNEWASIREHDMRIVFQDYKLLENFTVYDNIHLSGAYSENQIQQVFSELDIEDLQHQYIHKLSGGQKQRVAIARAAISKPRILLLDEPTGNLDGMSTERIMNYLNKLRDQGILIFIITHDEQVARLADAVYEIKNQQITVIKDGLDLVRLDLKRTFKPNSKKKIWQYVLKNISSTKRSLFLLGIPTIIVIILFILGFSAFRASTTQSFQEFFSGVGDRTILLNTDSLTQEVIDRYNDEGVTGFTDGKTIAFSEEDKENVEAIHHVDAVQLFSDGTRTSDDQEGHWLNFMIHKDDFTETFQRYLPFDVSVNRMTFQFSRLPLPGEYHSDYNPENLSLLAGELPRDNHDELLLPDAFVLLNKDTDNFESTIGMKIRLPVEDAEQNKVEKEYTISGVYDSEYKQSVRNEYLLYLGHSKDSPPLANEDTYHFFKNILTETPKSEKLNENLIETYDDFVEAYGTGYTSMFIRVNGAENIEEVSANLKAIFPAYKQTSRYDLKHGELSAIYGTLVRVLVIGSVIISLVAGIIIAFLNKGHINNRSKELAILYTLGYKRNDIFSIIALENILLFSFYLLISSGVSYLLNKFYFSKSKYYQLFNSMLELDNLGMILLLIALMSLVSIIWGMNSVKLSNLRKYLNESSY